MPIADMQKIEEKIQQAKPEEQQRFLLKLPHLLNIPATDFALLKLAEQSFDFWNNIDDTVYDSL